MSEEPIATAPPQQPARNPAAALAPVSQPAMVPAATAEPPKLPSNDPLLLTRERLSDLVVINDALKAFHAKTGEYPVATDGLKGVIDRGNSWIPGLVPDYLPQLPAILAEPLTTTARSTSTCPMEWATS